MSDLHKGTTLESEAFLPLAIMTSIRRFKSFPNKNEAEILFANNFVRALRPLVNPDDVSFLISITEQSMSLADGAGWNSTLSEKDHSCFLALSMLAEYVETDRVKSTIELFWRDKRNKHPHAAVHLMYRMFDIEDRRNDPCFLSEAIVFVHANQGVLRKQVSIFYAWEGDVIQHSKCRVKKNETNKRFLYLLQAFVSTCESEISNFAEFLAKFTNFVSSVSLDLSLENKLQSLDFSNASQ